MDKKFDLTTNAGILAAVRDLGKPDLALILIPGVGPIAYLAKKGMEAIGSVWNTTESTIKEQAKAAVEIIRAGKDCDADSIEVTLDQRAGLHLGSEVEGIPLEVMAGKSGHMTIKVKYKEG